LFDSIYSKVNYVHFVSSVGRRKKVQNNISGRLQLSSGGLKSLIEQSGANEKNVKDTLRRVLALENYNVFSPHHPQDICVGEVEKD
jgi:hypothetical protein